MENENKSAVEKFLEGTQQEESIFGKEEKIFEQPKPEAEEKEKEEKILPFHKDPKLDKYLAKREREIEARIMASIPRENNAQTKEDEFKDVIDSFTTVIGNDTPEKVNALNALAKSLKSFDDRAIRRAEEKIEEIQNRQSEVDRKAEEELDNAFENIEETFDVDLTSQKASKIRSDFVTFVERIAPKDRNGDIIDYPDMNSAWETFSEIQKSNTQPSRAKELASRSMSRSAETSTKPIEKVNWKKADEFLDTL